MPIRGVLGDSTRHSTPIKARSPRVGLSRSYKSKLNTSNDKSFDSLDSSWINGLSQSFLDGTDNTCETNSERKQDAQNNAQPASESDSSSNNRISSDYSKRICEFQPASKVCVSETKSPGSGSTKPNKDQCGYYTQLSPPDNLNDSIHSTLGFANHLRETLFKNAKSSFVCQVKNNEKFNRSIDDEDENQDLSFYGLPLVVKTLFEKHHGIMELYDWQKECLSLNAVQERRNLVYSLPTSGGKTLVAEVLILKELLCRCKNALFIFPFVCIVQEKVRALSSLALELGFVVEEYAGGKGQVPPRKRRTKQSVFIATIEKAHLLVNSLIELERISEIGLVVVDELHMLFEGGDRGADLEMLLTKLKLFSEGVHIIGMSATINNIQDVAKFLKAEIYQRNFRPVELKEYVKVEKQLWSIDYKSGDEVNVIPRETVSYECSREQNLEDPDQVVGLVCQVIPDHSCLVFCPTKKRCQNLAMMLCKYFPKHFVEHRREERSSLLAALKAESGTGGLCPILKNTIPYGVAHHHSGLTMDERRLIEEAYSFGTLCVLSCTSTLAAGVNLPAKRVIIRTPYIGTNVLSAAQYKQMVGRAGRAGLDSSGESIIILKPGEQHLLKNMFYQNEADSTSSLFSSGRSNLLSCILSLVGLKLSSNKEDIKSYVEKTLYGIQNPSKDVSEAVDDSVNKLLHLELLTRSNKNQELKVTGLGTAVMKSSVEIQSCKTLLNHLKNALKCLSLLNHLHMLYLVTPFDLQDTVVMDPHVYYSTYLSLSSEDQQTATLIGVSESAVTFLMAGRSLGKKVDRSVVNRFYATLALYELWHQKPLALVAEKFNTHKGTIHNLLGRASACASSLYRFTQELSEFWALADLLPNFVKQLQFCCQKELLPLMEIPAVKQGRARQLYSAGYKSVMDVATANASEMSSSIEYLPRKVAHQIISAAKMLLMEQAEALQDEVNDLVEGLESRNQDQPGIS